MSAMGAAGTADVLRFGVPKKGRWDEVAFPFLESCGLKVKRESERQLTAQIQGLPGAMVILQRAEDIVWQVAEGKLDVGMTGSDLVAEFAGESDEIVMLHSRLGMMGIELVAAVPDSWLDVSTLGDLADVAVAMRERGEELRVATKFPNLTRRFLYEKGITHFSFVLLDGGVEAAPGVDFGDVVFDITTTGTTIRENHLKILRNGVVSRFEACLVGNRRALAASPAKREVLRRILELVEARLRAGDFFSITANLRGTSEHEVARALLDSPATHGERGPTVSRVYTAADVANGANSGEAWFAATILVGDRDLQPAVDHLRAVGGSGISVVPVRYLFDERCSSYEALLRELGIGKHK